MPSRIAEYREDNGEPDESRYQDRQRYEALWTEPGQGNPAGTEIIGNRNFAHVKLQDLLAALNVKNWHDHPAVEATRPKQRQVLSGER